MQREEKSERSRRAVLDAALHLFSHHGFRATTVREIADRAKTSTGNVYHHFPDKDAIFRALIGEYFEITGTSAYPFTRALYSAGRFPENLEQLGFAARDSVREFKEYLALVYVDVIEFGGTHIQQFFGELGERFNRLFEEQGAIDDIRRRLRPGVSPTSAILLTTRVFFYHFSLEILFGVQDPGGRDTAEVVSEIADILRKGIVDTPER